MTVHIVWVIILYNFLHMQAGQLPTQYPNYGACNLARVQQGLANVNVMGYHGECVQQQIPVGQ
jgi:hypothetical protein